MYMISIPDHAKISRLISQSGLSGKLEPLEKKLYHANVVEPKFVPENLITMNSELRLRDVSTGHSHAVKLVYELAHKGNQVSVLAPLGMALLAARENATITYKDSGNQKIFVVEEILFQPEAAGEADL